MCGVVWLWLQSSLCGAVREIRVATFNTKFAGSSAGDLVVELGDPGASDPRRIAEIIQRVNPDVILLNEFDYDAGTEALERFQTNFLGVGQNGQVPIEFPFRFAAPSNTGIASCFDLDNNGRAIKNVGSVGYGDDAFGFGEFPGQFGMAVLSKFPILAGEVRTFQNFLWRDMPGARLPDIAITPAPQDWYNAAELEVFRLSSKSHWDLPIDVDGQIVHLLAAHPTPPAPFDGPEDSDGLRNHDEIRLWADYVRPGAAGYLYDDGGSSGGIGAGARFVICGDYNADPVDGDSVDQAINQLLENPMVNASITPQGASGTTDTSTFGLRVDYVLPSVAGFVPKAGAVFWPLAGEEGAGLVGASDHRLVWMDLELTPLISDAVGGLQIGIDEQDVVIGWDARSDIDYGIECSVDLSGWEELAGAAIEIADGVATFRHAGAATMGGRKFYRITAGFSAGAE